MPIKACRTVIDIATTGHGAEVEIELGDAEEQAAPLVLTRLVLDVSLDPVPELAYKLQCRGQVIPGSPLLVTEVFVAESVAGRAS